MSTTLKLSLFLVLLGLAAAKETCKANQILNGDSCVCAAGYFTSSDDESKQRCEDECAAAYFTYFTYGHCAGGLFDRVSKEDRPACDMRCGLDFRLWAVIALFATFAAAVATLIFTIPMCIATCASCIHSRKAVKHTKRVANENAAAANGAASKDLQAVSYNPYAYWPYYGRVHNGL
ncbi:unnamed protein product [Bursaphelenchus xylophilus]|uniref:(pine wood nematode) hypothetical protein n=1 Tax=Bursaphelenchus xylophilus TaxID=6326 RepID=A0A1I7S6U8_BURXY|nr:unnamed protein product [Bursaphelenchus xylophilus]CAG9079748.1 unnamed protein product [Bursaphelenchus xylophilus]